MVSGRDDRRGDGAGTGTGTGDVTTGDRLAAAVDELYGAAPEAFTGRRGELAAAARDAGDRAAAKGISSLRRPTRAAWVVNRLARADPGAPGKLAELAAALRAAQQAGHGPRLRELSAARGSLVDALTAQALVVAEVADPPPSLRLEVTQTLTAAIADPEVAADFAAGTLTHAVQWSGFGVLPADTGDTGDTGLAERDAAGTTVTGRVATGTGRSGGGARAGATGATNRGRPGRPAGRCRAAAGGAERATGAGGGGAGRQAPGTVRGSRTAGGRFGGHGRRGHERGGPPGGGGP